LQRARNMFVDLCMPFIISDVLAEHTPCNRDASSRGADSGEIGLPMSGRSWDNRRGVSSVDSA
jgi:hypothetical protein